MSDITVGFSGDFAEGCSWTCSRAIAHDDRSVAGQQEAVATGEGNRVRNAFDTEPAIAARQHDEVRQICGRTLFAGIRRFLFGLRSSPSEAPRGGGFEPVLTESGYVHRSEDVCYRVQLRLHLL